MILYLLLAAGGMFAYQDAQKKKAAIGGPIANSEHPTQPEQKYPFKMPVVARGDINPNQQPWYGGSTAFLSAANRLGIKVPDNASAFSMSDGLNLGTQSAKLWNELDPKSWFDSDEADDGEPVVEASVAANEDFSGESFSSEGFDYSYMEPNEEFA